MFKLLLIPLFIVIMFFPIFWIVKKILTMLKIEFADEELEDRYNEIEQNKKRLSSDLDEELNQTVKRARRYNKLKDKI